MNRRLNALRVGNFKAFAATQRIPLKPITLVFGPNSAGKSSFIHSLALAHEAQFGREKRGRSRLDVFHTDIGGNSIDLGGFRQYIFRGQLNRRAELGADLNVSELDPKKHQRLIGLLGDAKQVTISITIGMELDDKDQPVGGSEPEVVAIEFLCDGEDFIRMSRRRAEVSGKPGGSSMRVDRINTDHTVFQTIIKAIVEAETTTELKQEDLTAAKQAISDLLPDLLVRVERLYPSAIELSPRNSTLKNIGKAAGIGLLASAAFGPLGLVAGLTTSALLPVSKGNRAEQLAQTVRLFIPGTLSDLILGICDVVASEIGQFNYLGPLRSFPPRHLAFAESEDANWYAGGGYAWDVVRRDDTVRDAVNGWLGAEKLKTRYKLVVRSFRALEDMHGPVVAALDGFDDWRQSRADIQGVVDALSFEVDELEREIEDLKTEVAGLEDEVQELEDETNQLQSEIDGMEFEIDEAESELTSAETVRDLIETALERDADEQLKKDLSSVHSKAGDEAQTKEWERDALNSTRDEKQSALDDKQHELSQKQGELEEKQDEIADKQNELEAKQSELDDKQSELNPYLGADMSEDRTQELLDALKASDSETIRELALIDQRTGANVSHRDVGIGISQVLPVLVMAYGSQGKILAMEQPEIHLHPALQAELGDVFIESALGARKNTFILETHSEHLILRLLRRIRETTNGELVNGACPISPQDVAVLYVVPDKEGSVVTEIPIRQDGEFITNWPDGFFPERAEELF